MRQLIAGGQSAEDEEGQDPSSLEVAAANGHAEVVRVLLEAGFTDSPDAEAFFEAVRGGHLAVAQSFLRAGSDANAEQEDGTLLQEAARLGHISIVQLLLEHGAALEPYVRKGDTRKSSLELSTLYVGTQSRDPAMIEFLIASGAALLGRSPDYWRALPRPEAQTKWLDAARWLNSGELRQAVGLGVDVNQQDEDGNTALHLLLQHLSWAEKPRHDNKILPLVQLLAQAGADLSRRNRDGLTPLMEAAKQGLPQSARALCAALPPPREDILQSLRLAASGSHATTMEALLTRAAALSADEIAHWRRAAAAAKRKQGEELRRAMSKVFGLARQIVGTLGVETVDVTFDAPLDPTTAVEASRYSLLARRKRAPGREVAIKKAEYRAGSRTVSLFVEPGAVREGDLLEVKLEGLTEASGRPIPAQTRQLRVQQGLLDDLNRLGEEQP